MNSMPQQEVANGSGQIEFFRARPTTFSRLVAKNPAPSSPSGLSATFTLSNDTGCILIYNSKFTTQTHLFPLQRTSFNNVQKANQKEGNKKHHLHKACVTQFLK